MGVIADRFAKVLAEMQELDRKMLADVDEMLATTRQCIADLERLDQEADGME